MLRHIEPASYENEGSTLVATQEAGPRTPGPAHRAPLRWAAPIVVSAVPWLWFVVRDRSPALDAVAFVLPLAVGVTALLVLAAAISVGRARFAVIALSLVVFDGIVVVGPRVPQASPTPVDPFRLVSSNTFQGNRVPAAAARALLATHPDVLVTVETRRSITTSLGQMFAHGGTQASGGLDVFSVWPVGPMAAVPRVPGSTAVRVEVLRPGAPFVLYALHLANPLHDVSFTDHAETVRRLLAAAEREDLPVVLAGDFNMSDRTTSYRALDGAFRDAMRASFAGSTYDHGPWGLLELRIDHVFTSRSICAASPSVFGVPGSDHDGLDVELGDCPP